MTSYDNNGALKIITSQADPNVSRGYVNIEGIQSTGSASFTKLATADEITGLVVPTGGLLKVYYQALWATSGPTATAAIFLNSAQLSIPRTNNPPAPAQTTTSAGFYVPLNTDTRIGLKSTAASSVDATFVTTGQLIGSLTNTGAIDGGGPAVIEVDAGTYTVSVQFSITSGTVLVQKRSLWVEAVSFN